jgi:hypothetical protein
MTFYTITKKGEEYCEKVLMRKCYCTNCNFKGKMFPPIKNKQCPLCGFKSLRRIQNAKVPQKTSNR